jgi:co-chaperonin GroES (HSP10)
MTVKGKILPLGAKVLISSMEFGMAKTTGGIYIPSQDGKTTGIKPRWGRVYAVGPEQRDVQVGEWILVEHGRWTRTIEVEEADGTKLEVRMVDNEAIMMISDEIPSEMDIIN